MGPPLRLLLALGAACAALGCVSSARGRAPAQREGDAVTRLEPPPKLNAPIVMAHGYLGFGEISVGRFRLLQYFNGVGDYLRSGGNEVFSPTVCSGPIEVRARELKRKIEARFGPDRPIHIMAHSMGGLDARFMISRLGMSDRVVSLTTLGSPHRGTALARIGDAWRIWPAIEFAARLVGARVDGIHDLTPERMEDFDHEIRDSPEVDYYAVAGVKAPADCLWILKPGARGLQRCDGPNDGIVPMNSAGWGQLAGVWDCDHVNMVGWTTPWAKWRGRSIDVRPLYGKVLNRLKAAEDARGAKLGDENAEAR